MRSDEAPGLREAPEKDLLRFLTCGSVDDGKSTLIGRLLFETQSVFVDELERLKVDSRRFGTGGTDEIDYALLLDGLSAEREQGITIDVAYRYFSTPTRKFIVADTPGHRQYTRNMATGASTADLALLLLDARQGLVEQTRRHAYIAALLGIRQVVLAVNKMDLVGFSETVFRTIAEDFQALAAGFGFTATTSVPISARGGDNVAARSVAMPWHAGPSVLEALERAEARMSLADAPFRFPVQWVNRPGPDFRGYSGTVAGGRIRTGDPVVSALSGTATTVAAIVAPRGKAEEAAAGEAVTLVLSDEIELSRGDMLVPPQNRPQVADQFGAHLIWMSEQPLLPGRGYLLKCGSRTVPATITELKNAVDVNTLAETAAKTLRLNEIGFVKIGTGAPLAFDPFDDCAATGAFILIDRFTNETVAAGMIRFALRRAENIHWQALNVSKALRGEAKHQTPVMLWFTGLSGSGKSTIANLVERRLHAEHRHTYLLDGDNVRHGLNRDLGFTDADRVENIRRVAEVGKLFLDAGLITLVSFISPFRAERLIARELLGPEEFIEVFVDAPLSVCEARDPKGLYAKARSGLIRNFTGIDSPYEPPDNPELHLRTAEHDAETLVETVVDHLRSRGFV